MSKFIELTNYDTEQKFLLNVDYILRIEQDEDAEYTDVIMSDDDIAVEETPEQIKSLLGLTQTTETPEEKAKSDQKLVNLVNGQPVASTTVAVDPQWLHHK